MKNKRNLGLLLMANCLLIISCSSKKQSPEQVTLSFFDLLYNDHDIEKAQLLVTDESKEKLRNDFKFIEGALQIVEENDPTHYEYKVEKEKTLLKNDSAFVFINSSLDTTEMKILLVQINQEWKIDFNYEEHTLNTANKELVDEVLDLMEGFVDSITVEGDTLSTGF